MVCINCTHKKSLCIESVLCNNDWFYGELCITGKDWRDYKACHGCKEREGQGDSIICYGCDGEDL